MEMAKLDANLCVVDFLSGFSGTFEDAIDLLGVYEAGVDWRSMQPWELCIKLADVIQKDFLANVAANPAVGSDPEGIAK